MAARQDAHLLPKNNLQGQGRGINLGFHRGVFLGRNRCFFRAVMFPSGVILSPITAVELEVWPPLNFRDSAMFYSGLFIWPQAFL